LKLLRHDADDFIRESVDRDRPANDGRIARERSAPQSIAQDRATVIPRDAFVGSKGSAVERRHAQDFEEARAHPRHRHTLGFSAAGQIHVSIRERPEGCEPGERHRLLFPVLEIRKRRESVVQTLVRRGTPHHDQSIWLLERQRLEQYHIDERKDCRVRTDT
jgi:hypothetical protein